MVWNPGVGVGVQVMDHLQMRSALQGYHLIDAESDCEVNVEGSLSVSITSGSARLGGSQENINSQTESLPNPDADNPRKALVYLDSDGNLNTLGGDPAPAQPEGEIRDMTFNPSVPIPDEKFIPLAEVWIGTNASEIVDNDIISRRIPFDMGSGSGLDAHLFQGDSTINHHDLGSVGSGDHHSRYSDSEASSAAPVQSVNNNTGYVNIDTFDVTEVSSGTVSPGDNANGSYTSFQGPANNITDNNTPIEVGIGESGVGSTIHEYSEGGGGPFIVAFWISEYTIDHGTYSDSFDSVDTFEYTVYEVN